MGMSIMQERAAAIQAQLSLISEPGAGTQVQIQWPAATNDEGASQ